MQKEATVHVVKSLDVIGFSKTSAKYYPDSEKQKTKT
jgi:hypothetical protein